VYCSVRSSRFPVTTAIVDLDRAASQSRSFRAQATSAAGAAGRRPHGHEGSYAQPRIEAGLMQVEGVRRAPRQEHVWACLLGRLCNRAPFAWPRMRSSCRHGRHDRVRGDAIAGVDPHGRIRSPTPHGVGLGMRSCGAWAVPPRPGEGSNRLAAVGPIAPRNASLMTELGRPTTPQRLIGSGAFRRS
jgi:hypothetical protein